MRTMTTIDRYGLTGMMWVVAGTAAEKNVMIFIGLIFFLIGWKLSKRSKTGRGKTGKS